MEKENKVFVSATVGIAITLGIAISNILSIFLNIQSVFNYLLTFLISVSIHNIIYKLLQILINHVDLFLKLYWGAKYIRGYWSYTYYLDDEKRYGAWCIEQDINNVTVKGFGVTEDGRRSDVQSITTLLKEGNDYVIINQRRDVMDNNKMSDIFNYSKTILHFLTRSTIFNIINYPLEMTGNTYIYGGQSDGKTHSKLKFMKQLKVKNESDLEKYVVQMIKEDNYNK